VNNGIFVQDVYGKPGFDAGLPRVLTGSPNPLPMPYHYPGGDWKIDLNNKLVLVYDTRYGTNTSITLQVGGGSYNIVIDWGDGIINSYSGSSNITYTYNNHGIYTVQISGSLVVFGSNFTNSNNNKTIKLLSFGNLPSLTSLNYGFSNSSNIGHPNLIEIPKSIPTTITNLNSCFAGCFFLNDPKLSSWDVSNVTSMQGLFNGAGSFNQNLNNWNVSNVTDMSYMFQSTAMNQPLNNWNTSKVTTFRGIFNGSAFNQNISSWDTSNATDMGSMFSNNTPFNQPIGSWNTIKATDMSSMFFYNTVFNQNLSNWNVRKVTNFTSMFNGAGSFNSSLSGWALGADTAGANCSSMFQSSAFNNNSISSWDTSKVTNMSNMFANITSASGFNQDIGSWNTSSVTNMSLMFYNNTPFNNGGSSSINGWNTSNVTTMTLMFYNTYFNQPIGNWNVSKVADMSSMFSAARLFDQNISNWNLAGLNASTSLDNFMLNKTGGSIVALSTANYDALLIGWNNNKLAATNGVANWRTDLRPNFGGAKYTAGGAAATARAALVSYGWTITDGGSV